MGTSEVLEDDYGIAVLPEHFVDIVTGVDPSKFAAGSGRIGEEVLRRGLGFGAAVGPVGETSKKKRASEVCRKICPSLFVSKSTHVRSMWNYCFKGRCR